MDCKAKIKVLLVTIVLGLVILILIACTPPQTSNVASDEEASVTEPVTETDMTFTYSSASDCLMCHAGENGTHSLVNCEAIQQSETQEGCMVCHSDESGLIEGHEGVLMTDTDREARAFFSKVTDDTCLTCHNQEEIVTATSDSIALTDANGLTIVPHTLLSEHNGTGQHDATVCASCHNMHADKPIETTAKEYCLSCHHQDVFECYKSCHTD